MSTRSRSSSKLNTFLCHPCINGACSENHPWPLRIHVQTLQCRRVSTGANQSTRQKFQGPGWDQPHRLPEARPRHDPPILYHHSRKPTFIRRLIELSQHPKDLSDVVFLIAAAVWTANAVTVDEHSRTQSFALAAMQSLAQPLVDRGSDYLPAGNGRVLERPVMNECDACIYRLQEKFFVCPSPVSIASSDALPAVDGSIGSLRRIVRW